jgi:hypothetical protein
VNGWAEAASFARQDEARLVAGRLEAEGIPARLYPEDPGGYYGPETSAMLGQPIAVFVPDGRLGEARGVLDRLRRA